jgi:hypothetical protein
MRRLRLLAVVALGAMLGAVVGCGSGSKYVPVSGVVRLNGKPYPNAAVMFQPVGGKDDPNPGRGSSGLTDENGRFVLKTPEGVNGAVVGTHQVKITTAEEGVVGFDPATGSPDNTPTKKGKIDPIPIDWRQMGKHTFDVPAGGTDQANFDLTNPLVK